MPLLPSSRLERLSSLRLMPSSRSTTLPTPTTLLATTCSLTWLLRREPDTLELSQPPLRVLELSFSPLVRVSQSLLTGDLPVLSMPSRTRLAVDHAGLSHPSLLLRVPTSLPLESSSNSLSRSLLTAQLRRATLAAMEVLWRVPSSTGRLTLPSLSPTMDTRAEMDHASMTHPPRLRLRPLATLRSPDRVLPQ